MDDIGKKVEENASKLKDLLVLLVSAPLHNIADVKKNRKDYNFPGGSTRYEPPNFRLSGGPSTKRVNSPARLLSNSQSTVKSRHLKLPRPEFTRQLENDPENCQYPIFILFP